ncbi:MAG: DNA-binding protein [Endomicrobiaceae bacterium]|jgi:probable addiction module antidote protein
MKKEKIILTDFREDFAKELKNDSKKLKYFADSLIKQYEQDKDLGIFLEGLKIIAIAQGGMTKLEKKSNIKRNTLYKMLSKNSNPELKTFANLLDNLHISMHFAYK